MSLYQNAIDIYYSNTSLHDGDTYSHKYKSILGQIITVIRKIQSHNADADADDPEFAALTLTLKIELKNLDARRIVLENKLMSLSQDYLMMLKAIADGQRDEVSVRLGILDAETDGIGSKMIFNMLGLPGSEAKAVELILQ